MPPKVKLHKNTGKTGIKPPNVVEAQENRPSGLSPEAERQFEVELCWCIQQLQTALRSGKLNQKQINDNTKALNTLMSNTAPIVKKRQVMRLSFDDYRAKMAAEEKKHRNVSIKITPAKPNQKSVFLKKSIFSSGKNEFRFNFDLPEETVTSEVSPNNQVIREDDVKNSFVPSDNSFRFNFSEES